MNRLLFIITLMLTGISAQAADHYVVDVRRNITLAESDPVYKDFYISNAPGSGFKKNMVVTAVRKINVRDASGASAVGEIQVPVGQLRIIAIYDKVVVAREFTLLSREELPMLEQIGIMTGDRIEVQGSFIHAPKKTAQVEAPKPANPVESAKVAALEVPSVPTPADNSETPLSSGETLEKVAKSSY